MPNPDPTDFPFHAVAILTRSPDDTAIVMVIGDGDRITLTRHATVARMVEAARALLGEARDMIEEVGPPSLWWLIKEAIAVLPDGEDA